MAELTITDIPDVLLERMRRIAEQSDTSVDQVAIRAFERHVAAGFPDQDAVVAMIRAHRDVVDDFVFSLPEK